MCVLFFVAMYMSSPNQKYITCGAKTNFIYFLLHFSLTHKCRLNLSCESERMNYHHRSEWASCHRMRDFHSLYKQSDIYFFFFLLLLFVFQFVLVVVKSVNAINVVLHWIYFDVMLEKNVRLLGAFHIYMNARMNKVNHQVLKLMSACSSKNLLRNK